jgi:hypothetical protein
MFISNRNASRSSSETDSPYVFGPRDTPLLSLNRTRSMRCDATGVSAVIVAHESHARARRTQKTPFSVTPHSTTTSTRAHETPPPFASPRLDSTRATQTTRGAVVDAHAHCDAHPSRVDTATTRHETRRTRTQKNARMGASDRTHPSTVRHIYSVDHNVVRNAKKR